MSSFGFISPASFAGRLSSFTSPGPADGLLDGERLNNRLLVRLQKDAVLRNLLLSAAASASADEDAALYLLLPQSVTLDDVRVTRELLETHLVLLQAVPRGEPRPFTSLNGLYGSVTGDGSIAVHGRLRRAAAKDRALGGSVGGWEQRGRNGRVPQLESQIVVLRETTLPPSARLPLKAPIGMLLISDPLFFAGCGWKLPLALRRVTHRFASTCAPSRPQPRKDLGWLTVTWICALSVVAGAGHLMRWRWPTSPSYSTSTKFSRAHG